MSSQEENGAPEAAAAENGEEISKRQPKPASQSNTGTTVEGALRILVESILSATESPFPVPPEKEISHLEENGQPVATLLGLVRRLVTHTGLPIHGLARSSSTRLAAVAHYLNAYLPVLSDKALSNLLVHVQMESTQWLCSLFQLENMAGYYHLDLRDGVVRVTRLALHAKFPNFARDGFHALKQLPVIYVSGAASALCQYICLQLGLPLACCTVIPHNTVFGSPHTMDVAQFERQLNKDTADGRVPLLLVASAGTPAVGHVDNLPALQKLCEQFGVWLHVRGHGIALRLADTTEPSLAAIAKCHSVTLSPGIWFGLPGSPVCTLYKTADPSMALASDIRSLPCAVTLQPLPIWLAFQYLGRGQLCQMINHAIELSKVLADEISKIPEMKCVDVPLHCNHVVIFKFVGLATSVESAGIAAATTDKSATAEREAKTNASASTSNEEAEQERPPSSPAAAPGHVGKLSKTALDNLNSMLLRSVQRSVPHVALSIVRSHQHGECIRFSPIETAAMYATSFEDVHNFCSHLVNRIALVNHTLINRPAFLQLASNHDCLQVVNAQETSGLATLRFLPRYIGQVQAQFNQEEVSELNRVNHGLVEALAEKYSFVREVHTTDGQIFVEIGWLLNDIDIEQFVEDIVAGGATLEDSSRYLDSMSEVIRQGIEAAQRDLDEAAEKKLQEEGLLRQVPLVGGMLSWFMPQEPSPSSAGLSLNLQSGTLETTENTYRYRMQIASEGGEGDEEDDDEEEGEAAPHAAATASPAKGKPSE